MHPSRSDVLVGWRIEALVFVAAVGLVMMAHHRVK